MKIKTQAQILPQNWQCQAENGTHILKSKFPKVVKEAKIYKLTLTCNTFYIHK